MTRSVLHEKINFVCLLLIAFTLPFHERICTFSIIAFSINQLAEGKFMEKFKTLLHNKFALLFIGFYLLHLIGLAYTSNLGNGLFDLEKKAALLVFPILLSTSKINSQNVEKALLTFVASCFILSLIFLGSAFYHYFGTGDGKYFILGNLSAVTGIHRVYVSMYFLFCIFILFYFHNRNHSSLKLSSLLTYSIVIYFSILIFLLSSRAMVILTILSTSVIIITYTIKSKNILKELSLLFLFCFSFGCIIYLNKDIRNVLIQTYQGLDQGNSDLNITGPNQRIEIWKASTSIAKDNYLGVGTGDTEDELYNRYLANNFKWGIQNKFNAHNQYFETMIGLGLIGLLILLLSLLWPAAIAFHRMEYLYLGFIIIFSFACLTESMLCTHKGIVFYAFFNSLLAFQYPKQKAAL